MSSNNSASEDAPPGTYRTRIDLTTEPFEWAIYEAIAEGLGLDPQEDEIPVRDQINPEALASLFRDDGGEAAVSFPVRGACVTVRSDGLVEIVQE